jgi:hypothetical protein
VFGLVSISIMVFPPIRLHRWRWLHLKSFNDAVEAIHELSLLF